MTDTVRPMRHSADSAAMVEFLAALGLSELDTGGTARIFLGSSGQLGVSHVTTRDQARTTLDLLTTDAGAAVTTPSGLTIGRRSADPPSAELPAQRVAASMTVVAVCTVPDLVAEQEFLARYGFRAIEPGEGYLPLTAGPGSGVIGLRSGPSVGVELGFETSEPFDALADRMRAAGHPAETITDDSGVWVRLTDPDGATLEVRPTR